MSTVTVSQVSGQLRVSDGIDRISELPEALILHILSYLPTGDRFRTGALSRSWKNLWTCVPKLYFSWSYGRDAGDGCFDESDFVKHVNRTLILILSSGGSKVKDFGVKWPYSDAHYSDVEVWTRFAARHGIEKLELDVEPWEGTVKYCSLPQHLYKNSSLRELRLCYCRCDVWCPRTTISWSSLKKLTIWHCVFCHINKIVAGAPALEFLDVWLDDGICFLDFRNSGLKKLILRIENQHKYYNEEEDEIEIWAPSVQSLEVSGYFGSCKLVDMTSLVEATLFGRHPEFYYEYPILTQEVINSLSNVQTLTLDTWVIQGIAMLPRNDGRPLFPKCKCLTIDTHLWREDPSAIVSLLKSTPEVETLMVTMSEFDSEPKPYSVVAKPPMIIWF